MAPSVDKIFSPIIAKTFAYIILISRTFCARTFLHISCSRTLLFNINWRHHLNTKPAFVVWGSMHCLQVNTIWSRNMKMAKVASTFKMGSTDRQPVTAKWRSKPEVVISMDLF